MTEVKTEEGKRSHYIKIIDQKVGLLTEEERKGILQILINSKIPKDKLRRKTNGTEISFKDISTDTIALVYQYVVQKSKEHLEKTQALMSE